MTTQTSPVVIRSSLESLRDMLGDEKPVVIQEDVVIQPATSDVVIRDPVVIDLEYEERAAIMEFDGGLSRAEAEFEAALRSTVPLVPAAPLKEPAAPQGGKHAASQTQGEIVLTAEQILNVWRQHWAT